MTNDDIVCPHCRSDNARLLSDHKGIVGWCSDCHRPWIPPQQTGTHGRKPIKARVTELRALG